MVIHVLYGRGPVNFYAIDYNLEMTLEYYKNCGEKAVEFIRWMNPLYFKIGGGWAGRWRGKIYKGLL